MAVEFGARPYTVFAHGYTLAHGWYGLNMVGAVSVALAALFIPLLPSWARSRQTLAEQTSAAASA